MSQFCRHLEFEVNSYKNTINACITNSIWYISTCSHTNSFNKYLLSTDSMSGIVPGIRE